MRWSLCQGAGCEVVPLTVALAVYGCIVACQRGLKRFKVKKVVANFLIGMLEHRHPLVVLLFQGRIGIDID